MFKLKQTCGACPEQYDVFLDEEYVGFLHLRGGYFTAEYKDEVVYSARTIGDGCFEFDERDEQLKNAIAAIKEAMKNEAIEKLDKIEESYEIEY